VPPTTAPTQYSLLWRSPYSPHPPPYLTPVECGSTTASGPLGLHVNNTSSLCLMLPVIIVINEYPREAGLTASISIQRIYCRHELNKNFTNTIITLCLPVLHVGFVNIIQIPVTPKAIQVSLRTTDTANRYDFISHVSCSYK